MFDVHRDRLLGVIGEIHECAMDGGAWPRCLTAVGRRLHGNSTNLLYHDHRSRGGIQLAIGADPELYRLYREYGHAIDPWALRFRPGQFPSGSVVIGASVIDHGQIKKTEFYAAMGRRYEATRAIIGVLEADRYRTAALTVNRGDRGREFDAQDARMVSILVPHLRRALAIRGQLEGCEQERASLLDAMDRVTIGIVLVDRRARPIFVNRYASRLLAQRDGLWIAKESLVAANPATAMALDGALASAIAVTSGVAIEMENGELLIPRSAGRRPLHASVTAFGRRDSHDGLATHAAALLFLVDPEARSVSSSERLRQHFSLTQAEARVALAIAGGRNVRDMSDEFGVSRETVRSQVKRVLEKAGVRSQSAFIRLAVTEPMRLGDRSDR